MERSCLPVELVTLQHQRPAQPARRGSSRGARARRGGCAIWRSGSSQLTNYGGSAGVLAVCSSNNNEMEELNNADTHKSVSSTRRRVPVGAVPTPRNRGAPHTAARGTQPPPLSYLSPRRLSLASKRWLPCLASKQSLPVPCATE